MALLVFNQCKYENIMYNEQHNKKENAKKKLTLKYKHFWECKNKQLCTINWPNVLRTLKFFFSNYVTNLKMTLHVTYICFVNFLFNIKTTFVFFFYSNCFIFCHAWGLYSFLLAFLNNRLRSKIFYYETIIWSMLFPLSQSRTESPNHINKVQG